MFNTFKTLHWWKNNFIGNYPDYIRNHWRGEHVIQLNVFIFQNILKKRKKLFFSRNFECKLGIKAIQTLRLPLVQYSVRMQIFGGSVHAPMNAHILSCRRSRSFHSRVNSSRLLYKAINFYLPFSIPFSFPWWCQCTSYAPFWSHTIVPYKCQWAWKWLNSENLRQDSSSN